MNFEPLSVATLVAFATTTLLLDMTPGPAVLRVIGDSLASGWRPAQASILGILAGNAMYCALSVLGLGALLLAAPAVFEVVKWCGVAYLAWLGLKSVRASFGGAGLAVRPALAARPAALFRQSFLVQSANPKSVLYFCALLPNFAGEAEGAAARIAILGLVSMVIEYPVLLAYSLLGARARGWLAGPRGRRALDALAGTALLGAAATVATASLRRS